MKIYEIFSTAAMTAANALSLFFRNSADLLL